MKLNNSLRARYLCLEILKGVFKDRKTVRQILEKQRPVLYSFKEGDVARAERISDYIFVHLKGIDECINSYLKKNIKLEVRNILRVVVAESFLEEIPNYAVVNSAVKLSKLDVVTRYFSGLVNAVSRKIVLHVRNEKNELEAVLDEELRRYLSNFYPDDAIKRIEKLMSIKVPIDITVKSASELMFWKAKLGAIKLPTGTLRLQNPKKLATMPGFKEGKWWVQDISSSIPVKLLGNIEGQEVLDLFSAPGGKAMQLMSAGAKVTCLDVSVRRLKKLKSNFARMNMTAQVITSDILKFQTNRKYDIIVIDAPCSSSGTIRKNKELPHLFPVLRMENLEIIQRDSLRLAKKWVKDEGIILYCNCSLFPVEGEHKIAEFLEENQNWAQKVICPKKLNLKQDWVDKNGGLRLRPDHLFDQGGMDGFYATILIKKF